MFRTESIINYIYYGSHGYYRSFVNYLTNHKNIITTCFSLIISYFITIHIFYWIRYVVDFFICAITLFKISTHIFANDCDNDLLCQMKKTSDINELKTIHKKAQKIKKQKINYGKMLLRQIYVVSTIRTMISLLNMLYLLNYVPIVGLFTRTFLICVHVSLYLLLIFVQIPTAFINTMTSIITAKIGLNTQLYKSLHLLRPLSEEIMDKVTIVMNKINNETKNNSNATMKTIHDMLMKYESDMILI
jgi:hypothetical protein